MEVAGWQGSVKHDQILHLKDLGKNGLGKEKSLG